MKISLLNSGKFLGFFLILAFFFPGPLSASQDADTAKYPNRPITFIVPLPPGSGPELASRLIAKEAEKILGQPIVIINKPGASQSIGVAAIAAAKPDGYTIGFAGHTGSFVIPLTEKVPYHPVKDLRQILQYGQMNVGVTVKGDSPFKKFEDIVSYARQNPKKLTYGSAGTGSLGYLAMEQIAKKEKVQFTHIPFKGSPETLTALLGGHILVGTGDITYSLLEAGEIRLVLLLADNRSTNFPQTPILKDIGYDIPAPMFINVVGPKAMPDEIVNKLEGAFTKAIKEPSFIKGMQELRLTIVYRNSKEMGDFVAREYDTFAKVLKDMGRIK